MPGLRLTEVRVPELHLPEMSREDIVRAIGDARSDVDLSRLDPRRMERPDIDLSGVDVPKAIAAAVQAVSVVRGTRRPRLPFVIGGLITLGIVGYALVSSPAVKPRLTEAVRRARARVDELRATQDMDELAEAPEVASPVGVPIEPDAFMEAPPAGIDPAPSATDAASVTDVTTELEDVTGPIDGVGELSRN